MLSPFLCSSVLLAVMLDGIELDWKDVYLVFHCIVEIGDLSGFLLGLEVIGRLFTLAIREEGYVDCPYGIIWKSDNNECL